MCFEGRKMSIKFDVLDIHFLSKISFKLLLCGMGWTTLMEKFSLKFIDSVSLKSELKFRANVLL